jgi:hypothetical protein
LTEEGPGHITEIFNPEPSNGSCGLWFFFKILWFCGICRSKKFIYTGVCFLSVKEISLNSPEFSRKTNHKGEIEPSVCGAQRMHEATLIPSFRALAVKNYSMVW